MLKKCELCGKWHDECYLREYSGKKICFYCACIYTKDVEIIEDDNDYK